MSPDSLHIRSETTDRKYYCQRIHVNGAAPLRGNLECPEMFELPPDDDRVFKVVPLGFNIRITHYNEEPKQPSFIVLS